MNLIVTIPQNLTQKQKDLITEFSSQTENSNDPAKNEEKDEKISIKNAWTRLSEFLGKKSS